MLKKALLGAAFAVALGIGPAAAADVTITVLEVNQTNQPLWQKMGDNFAATHPGVKVKVDYLENEAFKAKLPTLLQSKDRPDIIYSWAGGVMKAQIEAGYIKDISDARADLEKNIYEAPLNAYRVDGKQYGIPVELSLVGFFYNKALVDKAGVDMSSIKTWDDLLAAVKTMKDAGVTPIVMGGGEKWPMHFYYSYLLMRIGGPDVLTNAEAGKDGGFTNQAFVEAGQKLKELSDLDPYQPGWLSTMFPASAGMFGDGRGALDLMGNWLLTGQVENAGDGKGLPLDQIGLAPFPTVAGGKGDISQTFGGVQGFLVTADAPPEAVEFIKFMSTPEQQKIAAEAGAYVPAVKGTDQYLKNPLLKEVAKRIAASTWHQNFLDQDLGPSVGRVVNDMSVAVAAGEATPEEAAQAIQEAWDQR